MAKIDRVQEIALADLKPYANNAKEHSPEQVELIARSIAEFGFLSPILIDNDKNIIAGHGRAKADACLMVPELDSQKAEGKSIYGRGLLLSEAMTEENKKAEANAEAEKLRQEREKPKSVWEISEREREIIRGLNNGK